MNLVTYDVDAGPVRKNPVIYEVNVPKSFIGGRY